MRNNEERFGTNPQIQDVSPPQQIAQSMPLDFIVPTEFVSLPSKGKFYPLGHPLRNQDSVEIKQMTAKEEDLLTSKSLIKKGAVIDKLIQSLVVDKNINTDSLTVEDRGAIIVAARISAYGPEYDTSVTCPSCSQKNRHTFNLMQKLEDDEQREIIDAPIDQNGFFSITLPVTKWSIVCRALNGNDEKQFVRLTEQKKSATNDSIFLDQLKSMIVAVQGITDKSLLDIAVSSLPAGDTRFLRREYQKIVSPFELKQNFVCSSCSYETVMEVPLSADFFWFK